MAAYTTSDYLLDRANIHDTVTKIYTYTDRHEWDKFDEFAAPSLLLDYTAMFGGEPRSVTPAELVETWKPFMSKMTSHQHVITSILIRLPQPGSMEKVSKAQVDANVIANLVRKDFQGGERTSNGGRATIEVSKVSDDPAFGNPWRVSAFNATPLWMAGNTKVLMED